MKLLDLPYTFICKYVRKLLDLPCSLICKIVAKLRRFVLHIHV